MVNRRQRRALEKQGVRIVEKKHPTVCFANINPGLVTCELFGSFVQLLAHDIETNHYLDGFIGKRSGGLLSIFRNGVVAEFLDDTDSDWLWMVDSDIVLEGHTLDLLMDAAEAHPEAQIISGWYVLPMMEQGNRADIFEWTGVDFDYLEVPEKPTYVDSVGLGCVMVHRDLLVAMLRKYGLPSAWFTLIERETDKHHIFGEDHSFFLRTREDFNQRPLLVPACAVGHVKSVMLTAEHLSGPKEQ